MRLVFYSGNNYFKITFFVLEILCPRKEDITGQVVILSPGSVYGLSSSGEGPTDGQVDEGQQDYWPNHLRGTGGYGC